MNVDIRVNQDQSIITIAIPISLKRRSGKKTIIAPSGGAINEDRNQKHDAVLLKNLVNAHRWQAMLDDGTYASINQLCAGENIPKGNITTVIRMVNLAPDIQQAILYGTHPAYLTRADFVKPFPDLWKKQKDYFGFEENTVSPKEN